MPKFMPCGRAYSRRGAATFVHIQKAICTDGVFCPWCARIADGEERVQQLQLEIQQATEFIKSQNRVIRNELGSDVLDITDVQTEQSPPENNHDEDT